MLAAYIDGNAYPIERNLVEEHIENENMCEILDIISDIESNPELVESIENIPLEIPEKLYTELDISLSELKNDIEQSNGSLM